MNVWKHFLLMLFLVMILSISIFSDSLVVKAAEVPSPYVALLEDILNNRPWVIQTLVENNYINNPFAKINHLTSGGEMEKVLTRYIQNQEYKLLVDIMEKIYSLDEYETILLEFINNYGALFLSKFGESEESLKKSITSIKELRYERILQEVLTANYFASHGATLQGVDTEYAHVTRLKEGLSFLKKLMQFFNESEIEDDTTVVTYTSEFLLPFIDTIETFFTSIDNKSIDERKPKMFIESLVAIATFDRYINPSPISGDDFFIGLTMSETFFPYFYDDVTVEIINSIAGLGEFTNNTIDSYMFIKSIQPQKESLSSTLGRIHEETEDNNLKKSFDYYITMMNYDSSPLHKTAINYLRSENVINDLTTKVSLKSLKSKLEDSYRFNMLPSVISELTGIAKISAWLADRTIDFGSTCKKIYELKYLAKIIDATKNTYTNDLLEYRYNKTDENAQRVLEDLQFLQKLRLRGEKISYEMIAGQIDSSIGILLSDGSEKDYWDWQYQTQIDILLGASVVGMLEDNFVIENEGTLNIFYNVDYGGLYGKYEKNEDTTISIPELYRKGVSVKSGGTINIYSSLGYLRFAEINGGTLNFFIDGVKLTELAINGGLINFESDKMLDIESIMVIGGHSILTGGNIKVEEGFKHIKGNLILHNSILHVSEDYHHSDGVLDLQNSRINITGDYLMQTLSGGYASSKLIMDNDSAYMHIIGDWGITVSGRENHASGLSSGTIEIEGNITYRPNLGSFTPSGTHRVILSGDKKQILSSPEWTSFVFGILEITNTSNEGVVFENYISVKKLFNHNNKKFELANGGSFPDYDDDGILDHLDPYPLDPTNRPVNKFGTILTIEEFDLDSENSWNIKAYSNVDTSVPGILVVCLYSNGQFLEFQLSENTIFEPQEYTIIENISLETNTKEQHEIKAFILTDFVDLMPLSNVVQVTN